MFYHCHHLPQWRLYSVSVSSSLQTKGVSISEKLYSRCNPSRKAPFLAIVFRYIYCFFLFPSLCCCMTNDSVISSDAARSWWFFFFFAISFCFAKKFGLTLRCIRKGFHVTKHPLLVSLNWQLVSFKSMLFCCFSHFLCPISQFIIPLL